MFIIKEKNAPMYFIEISGSTEVIGNQKERAKSFASEEGARRQINMLDNPSKYRVEKNS